MSGINFLSDNFMDTGSKTVTTGAENAQFPLSNLNNDATTIKFRSVGNTVVVEVDMLQTREFDTIAVVGDSTESLGITDMSFKSSLTTDFSLSTPQSITLSSEHNIGYLQFTSITHRFVEFTFTGTGSYAEISKIFIGKAINLPQNSLSISSFRYGYTDKTNAKVNQYGQKFIDIRNQVKFLRGNIEFCTKTEQEQLDDMFIERGRSAPIWMIVDPNSDGMNVGQFKLAMYGYLLRSLVWSAVGGQLYNTHVSMDQVV